MADRNRNYRTAFEQFYYLVQELRNTPLAENLYSSYRRSSTEAGRLFRSFDELYDNVRSISQGLDGVEGPNTSWNPMLPRRSTQRPGRQPANDHRPQTPPDTPPRRPRPEDVSEIDKLKNTLDERNNELALALSQLHEDKKSIISLRKAAASHHKHAKEFDLAAEQYDLLSKAREEEKDEKKAKKDKTGASAAEKDQLHYLHQKGKMLLEAERFADAEETLNYVIKRWKKTRGDDWLHDSKDREAQLLLCRALRSQHSNAKYVEAEDLYYKQALLDHLGSKSSADRDWAVRNAFELAFVAAEQGSYPYAVDQLKHVWSKRNLASAAYKHDLEAEIVQLLRLLEQRQQTQYASAVVAIACDGHAALPPNLLQYFTEQGKHYYKRGEYVRAIPYLNKAWRTPTLSRKEKLDLGWSFAWSTFHLDRFTDTRDTLELLLDCTSSNSSPSNLEVKALLACVQHRLSNFSVAENIARSVYEAHGASNLLGHPAFNHAGILIGCLIKHNKKAQYQAAGPVWQKLFEHAKTLLNDPASKQHIRYYAGLGRELATEWKKEARARKHYDPPTPKEILKQVAELERLSA